MIKSFMAVILSFLSQYSCAQTMHHSSHQADRPSVHGMAVVGTKHIYLSHLPMFHSPHDYQVLLEVQLDPASQAEYAKAKTASADELITIVPEAFVLPEMIAHPRPFKADLFKGHFERGGIVFIENATVTITKVIYFKKFLATDTAPATSHYILFGNAEEQFLAHQITAKPDFDQLLKVTIPNALKTSFGKTLEFANHANDKALDTGEQISTADGTIEVQSSLYLEFGDLAM